MAAILEIWVCVPIANGAIVYVCVQVSVRIGFGSRVLDGPGGFLVHTHVFCGGPIVFNLSKGRLKNRGTTGGPQVNHRDPQGDHR